MPHGMYNKRIALTTHSVSMWANAARGDTAEDFVFTLEGYVEDCTLIEYDQCVFKVHNTIHSANDTQFICVLLS